MDEVLIRFAPGLQPVLKHMAGQHDQRTHGHWAQAMSAGLAERAPTKGRPVKNPINGKDGTRWQSLPAELKQAQIDATREAFSHLTDPLPMMTQNVVDAYHAAEATPGMTEFGHRWYAMAHNDAEQVARVGGVSVEQGAAAIAAMSPKTGWEPNVLFTYFVAEQVKKDPVVGEWLDQPVTKNKTTHSVAEWMALEDVSVDAGARLSDLSIQHQSLMLRLAGQIDGQKVVTSPRITVTGEATDRVYGNATPVTSGIQNALHILRADPADPMTAITENLNGHKTRSFYNNIVTAGGTDSVTIDTHALDAEILGYESTHSGNKAKAIYGVDPAILLNSKQNGLSAPDEGSYGTYALFAEGFREATRIINRKRAQRGLPELTAAQVQAVAWIATLPPRSA